MILLLLILFVSTIIFLFYYEFFWKKWEQYRGKSFVLSVVEFLFSNASNPGTSWTRVTSLSSGSNWDDWRYRLQVELHRRARLSPEEGAEIVGVSADRVEEYLDALEGEGKVRQVGDAERGVYYKAVNEA